MRAFVFSSAITALFLVACGGDDGSQFHPDGGGDGDPGCMLQGNCDPLGEGGGDGHQCVGLECQIQNCGANPPTSLSGTVFAPNGTLPIYNVIVYVPNAPVMPITSGASCDKCGSQITGNPVVITTTDATGHFQLKDVPVVPNLPLVLQIGKWRRQLTIPMVKACSDTPLADPNMMRLPKNQSEGDMPRIALTTGAADPLGCILPKLGIDPKEFTTSTGMGKVNTFLGNSAGPGYATPAASSFWNSAATMSKYDITVLSCEGGEYLNGGPIGMNNAKPMADMQEMQKYLNTGGRVFSSHYHYVWWQYGPQPFPTTATWKGDGMGSGITAPFLIDTSFPKGKALADWLKFVEPTLTYGQLPINEVRNDVAGVNTQTSTRWVYSSDGTPSAKYLSFNTPVGLMPDQQCGKAVFGDLHIGAGNTVDANFPTSCPKTLTPQEKALIFLFFDLSSCIQKDDQPIVPPTPK
jgi:hypothetical protein